MFESSMIKFYSPPKRNLSEYEQNSAKGDIYTHSRNLSIQQSIKNSVSGIGYSSQREKESHVQKIIKEQWLIRDELLVKTLRDVSSFVEINKQLLDVGSSAENPNSYKLQNLLKQLKNKCENLIQIENNLYLKSRQIELTVAKLQMQDIQLVPLESMSNINEEANIKLAKVQDELIQQELKLNAMSEKLAAKYQEKYEDLTSQQTKLRVAYKLYEEDCKRVETKERELDQKISFVAVKEKEIQERETIIDEREQLLQLTENEARYIVSGQKPAKEVDQESMFLSNSLCLKKKIGEDEKESEGGNFNDTIVHTQKVNKEESHFETPLKTTHNNSLHSRTYEHIEAKIKELTDKEIKINQRMLQIEQLGQQLEKRSNYVQEQEKGMKDKRNQLFKSYDLLTEKIFEFERECEELNKKKRQLLNKEFNLNQFVKSKFKLIEAKYFELNKVAQQLKEAARAKSSDKLCQPVSKYQQESLTEIYTLFENAIYEACGSISDLENNLTKNHSQIKDMLNTKKLSETSHLIDTMNEALDLAFSFDYKKSRDNNNIRHENNLNNLNSNNNNLMINSDQWIRLEGDSGINNIYDNDGAQFDIQRGTNTFSLGDVMAANSLDQTIDALNQAIVIKLEDLGMSYQLEKDSNYQSKVGGDQHMQINDSFYKAVSKNPQTDTNMFNELYEQNSINVKDLIKQPLQKIKKGPSHIKGKSSLSQITKQDKLKRFLNFE